MMSKNLDKHLAALVSGDEDFGAFVRGTRREFAGLARHLLRHWAAPDWIGPEDVEQDLYMGAHRTLYGKEGTEPCRYDPTRGPTLAEFVTFGACSIAKREIHKARGVAIHRAPDKKPSPWRERNFSHFATRKPDVDYDSIFEAAMAEEAAAELQILGREERFAAALAALPACEDVFERIAVKAIRDGGSLEAAARLLYERHRVPLRLGSVDAADAFVTRHAGEVARRIVTVG
jgi:hypothetical protein